MVRLSEMDSGSIVFAGRTGRGGKTAGGVGCYEGGEARGRVGGTSGSGDVEVGEWKVAMGGGRGWWLWREKDLRFFEKFSYGG